MCPGATGLTVAVPRCAEGWLWTWRRVVGHEVVARSALGALLRALHAASRGPAAWDGYTDLDATHAARLTLLSGARDEARIAAWGATDWDVDADADARAQLHDPSDGHLLPNPSLTTSSKWGGRIAEQTWRRFLFERTLQRSHPPEPVAKTVDAWAAALGIALLHKRSA